MATSAVQVQFAIDDEERGIAIAEALLEERLVSCVQQVGPITSRYRWQGGLERSTEWLFLAKTTTGRVDEVVAAIVDRHPYDVPEVLVTEVLAGAAGYLAWNEDETRR